MAWSLSRPQDSPTTSMVMTSASASVGSGPALAEAAEVEGFQFVVDEAEYHEQEFLRGHGGPLG